jgi:hypothetical protein
MTIAIIVVIALAAGIAAFLIFRAPRGGSGGIPAPETLLLEEATITEAVAPGLEGKAEIRKRGAASLALRARATDGAQAYPRGTKVRVIDIRDGCCYVESADEEHLAR